MSRERSPALLSCLSRMPCFRKEDAQHPSAATNNDATISYDVRRRDSTGGGTNENRSESKRQQTKQWLQDLSTVAQFDVSHGDVAGRKKMTSDKGGHLQPRFSIDSVGYIRPRTPLNVTSTDSDTTSFTDQSSRYPCDTTSTVSVVRRDHCPPMMTGFSYPQDAAASRRLSLPPAIDAVALSQQEMALHSVSPTSVVNVNDRRLSLPPKPPNLHSSRSTLSVLNVDTRPRFQPTSSTNHRKPPSNHRKSLPSHLTAAPSLRSISSASSVIRAPIDTELVVMDLSATTIGLGITVVGQSTNNVDYGIYVGTVKPGGAAAVSGRINTGDWLLEVNGLDLAAMTNDVALKVIRMEAAKGGTLALLVSKFWKPYDQKAARGGNGKSKENNTHRRYQAAKRKTPPKKIVSSTPSLPPRHAAASRRKTIGGTNFLAERPHRDVVSSLARPDRQHFQASGRSSGGPCTVYNSLAGAPHHHPAQSVIHENLESLPAYYNVPMMNFYENENTAASAASNETGIPLPFRQMCIANVKEMMTRGQVMTDAAAAKFDIYENSAFGQNQYGAFRGKDLVDWFQSSVPDLGDRNYAKQYAESLLRGGYIYCSREMHNRVFDENAVYVVGKNGSWGGGAQSLAIV